MCLSCVCADQAVGKNLDMFLAMESCFDIMASLSRVIDSLLFVSFCVTVLNI